MTKKMENKESVIDKIVAEVLTQLGQGKDDSIPLELSNRHVHLSLEDTEALFGKSLTRIQELSQPGQFLCKERVRLIGPRGVIDNVAVLGPPRKNTQVELSLTDARILGLKVPVRQSGDIAKTPGLILSAGGKVVTMAEGVIVAARHIHMSPADALRFNVHDGQLVCVRMEGLRPAIFKDVLVRVHDDFRLAMHIDFDEANGCGCDSSSRCTIIPSAAEDNCDNGSQLN